jgi:hypothetical protein
LTKRADPANHPCTGRTDLRVAGLVHRKRAPGLSIRSRPSNGKGG